MRKKTIILILILMGSLSAYAEDMQKYLRDTQVLARQGKHQEALERYIWFHNHALEHEPAAMYGVRLSFALEYWRQLGEVYPPALAALKKTRDDKTELMEKGKGNRELFHDVLALNRTLNNSRKTVDLFQKLDQEQEELAKQCWDIAEETVIDAKEYELAGKYIGDPIRAFDKVKETYDEMKAMDDEESMGVEFKTFYQNSFVEDALRLIKVSLALDNAEAARKVQAKALAVLDDKRLHDCVPKQTKEEAQQKDSSDK
ncbi:hypothetical protein JXA32_03350 [Candidatus Sumerlaeota bacterium]|nr:hypothetical protein [Candidatus Sumerlaeota bacterium]